MSEDNTALAFLPRLSDIVDEYDKKLDNLGNALKTFEQAGNDLKFACTIAGVWGNTNIDIGSNYIENLKMSLKISAWRHVYKGMNIDRIATANDKRRFEHSMSNPPEFTLENIRATFGDYIQSPMSNILRGLAEVFCDLDPIYKSHEKMKIGVKGLPKRVILSSVTKYSSYGKDKLENILNALAAYQGKPLITYPEIEALMNDDYALFDGSKILKRYNHTTHQYEDFNPVPRGIWLKRYNNGNAHLYFSPEALVDINKALSEYYGEVLADCVEPEEYKKRQSTAVSKDLQYYPTPVNVVERVLSDFYIKPEHEILEPSCGCGRFLDELKTKTSKLFGIEVDINRVNLCRDKGYNVMAANFLEVEPIAKYDYVFMNPPFSGKHYAKHVNHAFKFLKSGGTLVAILPVTARDDHDLLNHYKRARWSDLPVGSFRESGTNINTVIFTAFKD